MKKIEGPIVDLRKKIISEITVLQEIKKAYDSMNGANEQDKKKLEAHAKSLETYLKKTKDDIISSLNNIKMNSPLPQVQQAMPVQQAADNKPEVQSSPGFALRETELNEEESKEYKEESSEIEKETVKRLKRKEEKPIEEKSKKLSWYVKSASKMFSGQARKLIAEGHFKSLERDLRKANLEYVLASYVSLIFYTTFWSVFPGIAITLFFLFFNISAQWPIITFMNEGILSRLLKVFWILILIPAGTFFSMYIYPSLEKRSEEMKINHELPFATIHMAAISGSMIDPTRIFQIIITTKEYPAVAKEFTKLLNQINVYGYDLVGALRKMAFNSPSRKLADLFNSLATAITSGGDLPDFFDKRASSLLFEYKLEREKQARAAETFMDIYISVVIAAPMILMLLLMMLKIGGLGIGLSTGAITITMILGVVIINIFFLTFLHLRQPAE
jgi:Flp pilus assembly protein TadB